MTSIRRASNTLRILALMAILASSLTLTGCVMTQTPEGNLAMAAPTIVAAPKDGPPYFYVEVPNGPIFDLTQNND